MRDYGEYYFSKREWIQYTIQGIGIVIIIGYLFYRHWIGVLILSPILLFYLKQKRRKCKEERKWILNVQFQDGLLSLSAALQAGYSVENAFFEARKDLLHLYSEQDFIIQEFFFIQNQLKQNITIEEALGSFALRSDVEDIKNFAEVFITAKRAGGNIVKVSRAVARIIHDKVEINREIRTMIAGKQLEVNVLKIMPFAIIFYLCIFSPSLLEPLYHNMAGIFFMSGSLLIYGVAFIIADKIADISV